MKTIGLIANFKKEQAADAVRHVASLAAGMGFSVVSDAHAALLSPAVRECPIASFKAQGVESVVVLGGDGTMLGAARQLAPYQVPVVGINHGRLGFITDIPVQDSGRALYDILHGRFETEDRMILTGSVMRGEQELFSATALNDVVLNRSGRGGMIELRVEVDGTYMYTQRADGLIVATPTGSTAYALSAAGPILHPEMHAMVLVPIAPQTLSNRPIVIPDRGLLSITLTAMGRVETGASVHFDMQTWSDLHPGDRIDVRRAPHPIRFLHPAGYSFFSTLRRKLDWNRIPRGGDEAE